MIAQDQLYPRPDILVTLLGNHDVLRFMSEPGATVAGLKLAQTLIMTTRGAPQLYYGDEIALPGGGDPDNRRDFPGGFANDARNAFERSGRTAEQQQVFEHVKRLTRTRMELEPLRRGRLVNLYYSEQQYAFARTTDREGVVVAINNDTKPATIEFGVAPTNFPDSLRLFDLIGDVDALVHKGGLRITLPARSACILSPSAVRD